MLSATQQYEVATAYEIFLYVSLLQFHAVKHIYMAFSVRLPHYREIHSTSHNRRRYPYKYELFDDFVIILQSGK